jgi:hypothetical protein
MKKLLVLSAVVLATSVFAQTAPPKLIAKVVSIEGLATVGVQDQLRNLTQDMRLVDGARVLVTSTGKLTIEFDSGCRVTLKPNDVFNVSESECKALLARGSAGPGQGGAGGAVLAGVAGFIIGVSISGF